MSDETTDQRDPATPESAAPEASAASSDTEAASGLARATGARILTGGRHLAASLRHTLSGDHQSDEEIRRLLVQRQLLAYEGVRETAREELADVRSRITRLEMIGAEDGWTPEQRKEVRMLREDRKRREAAARDMAKSPFVPAQPTPGQIKASRTKRSVGRLVVLLVVLAAAVALLVVRPQLLVLAVPAAVVVLWWIGRRPPALVQRPVPERLLAQPELAAGAEAGGETADVDEPEELRPYPIADASTSEEAEETLRRAIVAEGGDLAAVTDGRREPWGWSARVRYRTGSPDELLRDETYRNLITALRLRRTGLLVEPDPDAGDSADVRMMLRDPFTPELVGPVPYRAPRSTSITDMFDLGVGMDASQLLYSLAGIMLIMVGDSGSGKSGVMLAHAEAVTSTTDAVLINLDPVGTGVGDLGPAITLDACADQARIGAVLDFLLKLCTGRAKHRAASGWGNTWRVSADHPAFCVFLDEWPQLSEKNKKKWNALLLIGRKEAVWLYGCSQFGTSEFLGKAIGPKLSTKLMGACRRVDVTDLLGGGSLAEGYRADLLVAATHTTRGDAGQIYAQGLPGMPTKPMRYQVREITPEYAARVGAERAAAGLPSVALTLTVTGLMDEWNQLTRAGAGAVSAPAADDDGPDVPDILMVIAGAFVGEGDPNYLTLDQVHAYLRKDDAAKWGRWDDRDDKGRLRELGKALARELKSAGVTLSSEKIREADGQPKGYYADDVRAALTPES